MGRVTVVNHYGPPPAPGVVRTYVGRGRGSVLGNPFSHQDGTLAEWRVATREDAVARYAEWIKHEYLTNPIVHHALEVLARHAQDSDVELECWCAPLACHGDIIKRLIEPRVLSRDDELEDPDGNLKGDRADGVD